MLAAVVGHALMQMAEIYKELQHQADDNVSNQTNKNGCTYRYYQSRVVNFKKTRVKPAHKHIRSVQQPYIVAKLFPLSCLLLSENTTEMHCCITYVWW